ncbi:MAG TPA: SIR2 family protein [Pyrinomonadaceae bacterium]|nr:SIR2 family protein [Pyrinomonadaceae bacterium]
MRLTLDQATKQLIPLVENRRLILLAGAGVSYKSDLPLWDDLIERFIDFCREVQQILPPENRFQGLLDAASHERSSHPERVASVLKDELANVQRTTGAKIQDVFTDWLINELSGDPNDNHRLIVKTNYPFVLTSNYDTLLEGAAREEGFASLALFSYTFNDPAEIAAAIYEERPALIHIHGSMRNVGVGDFVFTADDYTRIKRQHPGFSMALDTLFIKYSTLFVGYGGSDPHLEDVAEGLAFKLREGWPTLSALPRSFLMLHKDKVNEVLDRYKGKLRTDIIVLENFDEMTTLLQSLYDVAPRPPMGTNGEHG